MTTAASEAEKPRNVQQKSMHRKVDAQRRSHSIQQKVGAAVRLLQEPSDEDHVVEFNCMRGWPPRSSARDTDHVEHLTRAAKRDMKLKYRTVVLEVPSRLPRRDRVSHSGVEDFSGPCRGRIPKTRRKAVLRVGARRCCKLPDRGAREHLLRTDDHAVAHCYEVVLEVPEEASLEL